MGGPRGRQDGVLHNSKLQGSIMLLKLKKKKHYGTCFLGGSHLSVPCVACAQNVWWS